MPVRAEIQGIFGANSPGELWDSQKFAGSSSTKTSATWGITWDDLLSMLLIHVWCT